MLGEQSRLVACNATCSVSFTSSSPIKRERGKQRQLMVLLSLYVFHTKRAWALEFCCHEKIKIPDLANILAEVAPVTIMTTHISTALSLNTNSSTSPASSQMTEEISTTSVKSLPNATMPDTLTSSLSTPGQPTVSFNATPQVSKQELQSATPVNTAVPENTSSPMQSEVIVSTKEKHPPTEATEVQTSKPPSVQKEVPSKMTVTPRFDNETVSSPTKDLETRSQGSSFEESPSTIAYPETTKSTEPKGPMPPIPSYSTYPQAIPELTQTPETGSHYMSGPFTTSLTPINNEPIFDSTDKSPSEKKNSVIILAVVFSILLLIGLLAFLYFRRRHHSGSTSFNSPEWAGQATLPDDTGLDKDVEQQVGSVGEGETRRGTLVTFFGKRQSRVPSIAMEDKCIL
ncbi:Muc1, partial [Ophiophagus hannah]